MKAEDAWDKALKELEEDNNSLKVAEKEKSDAKQGPSGHLFESEKAEKEACEAGEEVEKLKGAEERAKYLAT